MQKLQEMFAKYTQETHPVFVTLYIFLILYASMARPSLPKYVADLFNNVIFKILILSLIAYLSSKDLTLSLFVAIGFIVTNAMLVQQETKEAFDRVEEFIQYETFKSTI